MRMRYLPFARSHADQQLIIIAKADGRGCEQIAKRIEDQPRAIFFPNSNRAVGGAKINAD
jgi:hypothetical protein